MKHWDETFMGHEFSMNPIEVDFMADENLVIRPPLASMKVLISHIHMGHF